MNSVLITLTILKIFSKLMLILTVTMIYFFNSPMTLGILILMQSIFTSILITMSFTFSWTSLMMFLIYLGGILMIFFYVIGISSIKSNIKKKKKKYFLLLMITMNLFNLEMNWKKSMNFKNNLMISFSESSSTTMFFLVLLTIIMLATIFISEKSKSSVRAM
uniref:NADH dehydrogenase subunit 6 n=1 Tax=Ayyaria chaetophora TaxID=1291247 RepID=UPI0030E17EDA